MEERYLIDTSAVIKYLNGTFPESAMPLLDNIVDTEPIISFITEIELRVWEPTHASDFDIYDTFIRGSVTINPDRDIIEQTVLIRKKYKLKLPDAFIAATAVANDLTLIADNDKDFGRIDMLKYINPNH